MADSQQFDRRAHECLARVEDRLCDADPGELDVAAGDGMLTLEFSSGAKIIISRQGAASQIWVAAGARAFHYAYDEASSSWRETRDGHDLYERLSALVSEKLGRAVSL